MLRLHLSILKCTVPTARLCPAPITKRHDKNTIRTSYVLTWHFLVNYLTLCRVMKFLCLFLILAFSVSCSLYRSQGRRSFESDTPQRVPISLIFHCNDQSVIDWETMKSAPGLTIQENIQGDSVQLLASTPNSGQMCISESLDLAFYMENRQILASQLNTWP